LLDPCRPNISLLLEEALRSTPSRPVILAIQNMDETMLNAPAVDGKHWGLTVSKPELPEQALVWEALASQSKYLPDGADTEGLSVVTLPLKSFLAQASELWPVDVHPGHALNYPISQWTCRVASHYIFYRSGVQPILTQPPCFPISWLGPKGNLWTSGIGAGERGVADAIFRCLSLGEPTILLKGSGRATDFWSMVCECVFDGNNETEADVIQKMSTRYPFWYDASGDLYGNTGDGWLQHNLFRYVRALLRSGDAKQLRSSTVVVDMWQDSPEVVLQRLSNCFQNTSEGTMELGAGVADEQVIKAAWEQFAILEYTASTVAWRANLMTVAALMISFLSTALSVSSTYVETQRGEQWSTTILESPSWSILNVAMVVLPTTSGLLTTLLSRLRSVSKWGELHVAKAEMESDIYQFRIHAGEYDMSATIAPKEHRKKNKHAKANEKKSEGVVPNRRARDTFVTNTSAIFGGVVSMMQQDAMQQPPDVTTLLNCKKQEARHVYKVVPFATEGLQAMEEAAMPLHPDQEDDAGIDDLIGSLTTQTYMDCRVKPTLTHFNKQAPRLSWWVNFYEVLILVASLSGTLLGALQRKEWIPISVALGALLTSLLQYQALQTRLLAVNAGITDLTMVISKWKSLGVVEKRTRSVKMYIVDITEAAILREAVAHAAGVGHGTKSSIKKESNDTSESTKEAAGLQADKSK